jgi:hypothetical protein
MESVALKLNSVDKGWDLQDENSKSNSKYHRLESLNSGEIVLSLL